MLFALFSCLICLFCKFYRVDVKRHKFKDYSVERRFKDFENLHNQVPKWLHFNLISFFRIQKFLICDLKQVKNREFYFCNFDFIIRKLFNRKKSTLKITNFEIIKIYIEIINSKLVRFEFSWFCFNSFDSILKKTV